MSASSLSQLPRLYGLDTLRASAICLVFMYHYMVFVSHQQTFGWLSEVGWAGVDLFFVLSGYLIGNQIFKGIAAGHTFSVSAFYWRRAWRTLPVFWLVLAAYFLIGAPLGGKTPPALWRFLSFTQNLGLQSGTAFSHAWSLCIEEQFYLFLPLILLAAAYLRRFGFSIGVRQGWCLLGLLLLLGVSVRCVLWARYGRISFGEIGSYYTNVYYNTLCRFDEFLPGIALAMVKNFHPPLWQKMQAHGQKFFFAGLAACALMFYLSYQFYFIEGYGYGFFMSVFGYSLLAWAFALLIVAALSPNSTFSGLRVPGAQHLALWSYSIYLTHKPLAYLIQTQTKSLAWSSSTLLLVISLACLLCGAILYRLVELPCMAWRDRQWPSNFLVLPATQPAPN